MIRRPRSRLVAFAIVLPVLAMLLATTAVAAPNKPILVDISPLTSNIFDIAADDVAAGTCVRFEVTLENKTKTQMMGSANYTLDTDLVYSETGACPINVQEAGTGTATATGMPDDPVIELRDLNAAPGETRRFQFNALVPCTSSGTTYDGFSVIVKQANNYQGDPGNNNSIDPASDFDVQAVGFCQVFTGAEPGNPSGNISGSNGASYTLEALSDVAGTLIVAKGVNDIDCTGYTEHTDTVTVDFTGSSEKILTFSFPNTTHQQKAAYRVCFASPTPWTDRSGATVAAGVASLLPDCNDNQTPTNLPCMLPVTIQGQQVTIKAWLRPLDPPGKG